MNRQPIVEQRSYGAFRESKPRSGRREARLIKAGWGSSGYYSDEVLAEYGPKAWPVGTRMFLNHPTIQEESLRPERDVKDWCGKIATTPRMAGIDLIAEVEIFDHWKPVINGLADDVGLSIMAPGTMEHGDAGGKSGPIIKEIHYDEMNSVDFVTIAGAGGELGNLIESARGKDGINDDEHPMDFREDAEMGDTEFTAILREFGAPTVLLLEAEYEKLLERNVSVDERIALAKKGQAIPIRDSGGNIVGGRFPMANCSDVSNAAQSVGRTDQPNIKSFVTRVASKLSCPTPFKESRSSSGTNPTKEEQVEREEQLQRQLDEANDKLSEKDKEITTLTESRDEHKDRADRAEDALLITGAKSVAREVVDRIEGLPERAQDRIVEKAVREIPKDDKGRVNEDALKTRTKEAAKSELEYLAGKELEGELPIRESGGSTTVTTTTANNGGSGDSEEKLVEAFKAQGMSEDAAKIAARGR